MQDGNGCSVRALLLVALMAGTIACRSGGGGGGTGGDRPVSSGGRGGGTGGAPSTGGSDGAGSGGNGSGGNGSGGNGSGGNGISGGQTGGGAPGGGTATGGSGSGGMGTGGQSGGGRAGTASGGNAGATAGSGGQSGCVTSVSGTVFDPAAKVPLFNAMVYAPTTAVAPIGDVLACVTCAATPSGNPAAIARTDSAGHFRLDGVPAGTNVPLVIQIGKWRRQVTLPAVTRCADNAITDPNLTRLPRNSTEGHIPRIALSTGGADALECLLRKVGIEDVEFTPEGGPGRVNLFAGGTTGGVPVTMASPGTNSYSDGTAFTSSQAWWDGGVENLRKYDLILLSCEGVELPTDISEMARQAMVDYANAGGRVFMSHWHNFWIEKGPPEWQSAAAWQHRADPVSPLIATVDTSFAQGASLADWLVNVGASVTRGEVSILGAKKTAASVQSPARAWINSPNSVQYFSFPTPVGGAACGEVIFSDLHVSSGSASPIQDRSGPMYPFPTGCVTNDLSPQEKVLEFMLFDLLGCL